MKKEKCDRKIGYIIVISILLIANVFVWSYNISEENDIVANKYKMLTEMDESKEFMRIKFIQIDENFE